MSEEYPRGDISAYFDRCPCVLIFVWVREGRKIEARYEPHALVVTTEKKITHHIP